MSFISKTIGKITGADAAARGAEQAAATQGAAAQAGIDEQRRQFDAIQQLLAPFIEGGTDAFGAQGNLIGLGGTDAQAAAIKSLEASPEFQALTQQGEESILANASATGGLRGGNVQGALGQFRPALLASLINQQFQRLGGIAGMGQASAAGVGAAGQTTGANIAELLQQQGAASAGGQLARAGVGRQGFSDLLKIGSVGAGYF